MIFNVSSQNHNFDYQLYIMVTTASYICSRDHIKFFVVG